ncbi:MULTISPECIES: ribonuclease III [unclassified Francisella]|uniref:ribonuclease III n=1 Tax=unclassified Francisella TaxID=2610885 RepID=UPI002E33119B|nr:MULTISPECIES: ribonuclease III [unclassified Francisella]MED7819432.1 ribonuclease III [Francisella sp. 19S2-4]MED7830221.1 ribonuclease III [Francisella sp. 19S2-10]
MIPEYSRFYKILGYNFKDQTLLLRALTHRSKTKKNYERLEFLGDSILGFVIAEELYTKFPDLAEGKLSQIRSKLVKGATLAQLALQFKIDEYVILGASEQGGQKREKILEDIFEAIIGAIYLDSDFATVKKVVIGWYKDVIANINLDSVKIKDNKSKLQEILLQNSLSLPEYSIETIEGKDHEQIFTIKASSIELNINVKAQGTSRRKAEQQAAGKMIEILAKQGLHEKK